MYIIRGSLFPDFYRKENYYDKFSEKLQNSGLKL